MSLLGFWWSLDRPTQTTVGVLLIGAGLLAVGGTRILIHRASLRVDELLAADESDPEPELAPTPRPFSAAFDVHLNGLAATYPETVFPAGCPA